MMNLDNILQANDYNSLERNEVITNAVKVEYCVNSILSRMLGIAEPKNTKSFGHSASALSFISKITLLQDLNIVNSESKRKLELFATIRNRFAHLLEVTDFDKAITSEIYKNLRSLYFKPKETIDDNSDSRKILYSTLTNDVFNILANLYMQIEFKQNGRIINEYFLKSYQDFFAGLEKDEKLKDIEDYIHQKHMVFLSEYVNNDEVIRKTLTSLI